MVIISGVPIFRIFTVLFVLTLQVSQECFGEVKTVELAPGGSKKPVTKENR